MTGAILILILIAGAIIWFCNSVVEIFRELGGINRKRRRDYYRDNYLQSDAWQRKRFVVLRRDNWRCVECGKRATEVHHQRYARNIGNEPIKWLVSLCRDCHESMHN